MHTRDILNALQKLDTSNDDHWTIDGAPRIDALADLGLHGLTRDIVTSAAPLFSRTHQDLPDLDGMRADAKRLEDEAVEAEQVLKDKRDAAAKAKAVLAATDKAVQDSHALTRQNRAWIDSQNKVQRERIAKGAVLDKLIKDAGGPKLLGKHPVEINEAARIRAARRNFRLPQKPAAR